jgi:DNA-binding MarR family transcriptional regulator
MSRKASTGAAALPRRTRRPPTGGRELDLQGLGGQVGYLLRRAQLAVFADFTAALQALRLRPGQFGVLRLIGSNPGIMQNEVCEALGIQRANLVAVLDELEARGLAERRASTQDRRSNELHLSPAGTRLLERAMAVQAAHEARVAVRLGIKGRADLLRLLNLITDLSSNTPP